ncbi:MAG: hypothetical protein KDH96_03420 [Candidatus Riesia sp.]|nr:hypothetical protein [Candidatus Riesia sp.]
MSKSISKRGIVVDFDILKIKQEMLSIIPNDVVVERNESIEDSILKRREQRRRQRQIQMEQLKTSEDLEDSTMEKKPEVVEKTSKPKENKTRIIEE